MKGLHHILDGVPDDQVCYVLDAEGPLICADIGRSPQDVLDLGTGSGRWAMDFADMYPSAHVVGVDLSPIQPTMVPPNCSFELNDLGKEWLYPQKFDLIHGGHVCTFIDPLHIVRNAFNALKPGGVLELQEFISLRSLDNSLHGTYLKLWVDMMHEGLGRGQLAEYSELLMCSGFEYVECRKLRWPTNKWAEGRVNQLLGERFNDFLTSDLEGLSMQTLTKFPGWGEDEVTVLLARVRCKVGLTNVPDWPIPLPPYHRIAQSGHIGQFAY